MLFYSVICNCQATILDSARLAWHLATQTLIAEVFPKDKTYKVNGEDVHRWFSVDFTSEQLIQNVSLVQGVLSRPSIFDGTMGMSILDDVVGLRPPQLWINVQFFQEHKLSSEAYILSIAKEFGVNHISSPEVGFLKGLGGKLVKSNVKLIFRFLDEQLVELSTKQTYGAILKDLKSVESFASGILVPKTYIWPVNKNQYLLLQTLKPDHVSPYSQGRLKRNPDSEEQWQSHDFG